MPDDDTIIISNYKQRVKLYGLPALRAWVLVAGLLALGFILAKVF